MEETKIDHAAMGRLAKALAFIRGPDDSTAVALEAAADGPPTADITGPLDDEILASDDVLLEGIVSDDLDAPEALTVQWTSDLDGIIGSTPPDTSGLLAEWWRSPREPDA